jgi:putative heme-binding domain-containing protein
VLIVALASFLPDVEPWADAKMPVRTGLVVWLDATRLKAARESTGRKPPVDGAPIDAWDDASGRKMTPAQPILSSRPRYVVSGEAAALRFDGQDDFLSASGFDRALEEYSLFLVAAPESNGGGFRGLAALGEIGKNDYTDGLTVDLGSRVTLKFERLNVEGKGFGGEGNLMKGAPSFGAVHVLEVRVSARRVEAFLNGQATGRRPRQAGATRVQQLIVGARIYSNGPEPPFAQGFFTGDLAELVLFDRLLADAERDALTAYLTAKYAALKPPVARARVATPIADPPPVQMLVPGFTVRRLPLDLPNINNLRYRPDGKLMALGYNGDLYLLSDTNGDGLEDKVETFWDNKGRINAPIGLALTPPNYPHGAGAFVPSKGKFSLIVDTDADDRADREIVVADGWPPINAGVDAAGAAFDPRDGSVYFGLGTMDYSNAYVVDKEGRGHYDPAGERGTVLRVSPDLKRREIFCTGIRFPVGMAFNRDGELFVTDQEGATWLANGNPFDELLHLQKGRHYGFPPRHPKHLPGVIDEPSLFDYGPQHQSTCGMVFNDAPVFGPKFWEGDALVCGESRGKLYRTKLVRTRGGYVAQNHLVACLTMLTIDACVSPRGDLIVTTHSGPPDWGTGPTGKGAVYRISYTERTHPQPVLTWAAGPNEARVAFDRPLELETLQGAAARTSVEFGPWVHAGDRFESIWPGYAVVERQRATARSDLAVHGVQVSADRRTWVVQTAKQSAAVGYGLKLPGPARPGDGLRQVSDIDLRYDLCGVEARWRADAGDDSWTGWLPHLDLAASRAFTVGSADHDRLWELARKPGTLTMRAKLDLWGMLRPAVQWGATLDFELPAEEVTVAFHSNGPIRMKTPATDRAFLTVSPKEGAPTPVEVELPTGGREPTLDVVWFTREDPRERALPLRRLLLPWAGAATETAVARGPIPELAGGSWARGRKLFFSHQAVCHKCHRVGGQGGTAGPDLSNLVHRDYASVLRDIREPSATINPDFVAYRVTVVNGPPLEGVTRIQGDRLIVTDSSGQATEVPRAQVRSMTPMPISNMPERLDVAVGEAGLKDLLTFLLTEAPHMPRELPNPPPPRPRAELEALLRGAPEPPAEWRPLRIVLVAAEKDHGPGEHDYPAWQKAWSELLSAADAVTVTTSWRWPKPEDFERADVIVMFSNNPEWKADKGKALDDYLARGGGFVVIHWAVNGGPAPEAYAERIGLATRTPGISKYRHGPLELRFVARDHPIARGFDRISFVDETYWAMAGDVSKIQVLAEAVEDGAPRPQVWTVERGKGRVFADIMGHYSWTFDDPAARLLLLRGILWAAREPVDRFNALATPGARIAD